ncbi:Uncharacterised protein [Burkholderia pseudomallei]|nr:Uncharacterised protein [Burkholderia pseudomallei]CAK0458099.1 Uncharacterised protein [Burkholderia pseudomallei]
MSTQAAYSEKDLTSVSEKEAKEGLLSSNFKQYDGQRIKSSTSPVIYLVINGVRQAIPDSFTYDNLFISWSGVKQSDYLVEQIPAGVPLTNEAGLFQGTSQSSPVWLVTNGVKRLIPDGATFDNFYFNRKAVVSVDHRILDLITQGENIG